MAEKKISWLHRLIQKQELQIMSKDNKTNTSCFQFLFKRNKPTPQKFDIFEPTTKSDQYVSFQIIFPGQKVEADLNYII